MNDRKLLEYASKVDDKEILLCSFSGGETSAFMTKYMIDNFSYKYKIIVVFANSSQEREETLIFIKNCDDTFGFGTIWVEADVNPIYGIGTGHKIVDFNTASRSGEPFEAVIKKYGIPNHAYPHCTRELKLQPIKSYMHSLGIKKYLTAIGIRSDERRRIRKDAKKARIIYPLVDLLPTTKPEIQAWFVKQKFHLGLLEHQGNCTWCWKKTLSKHIKLIKEAPEIYNFTHRMEFNYGIYPGGETRTFFRGNRSTEDLFKLSITEDDVIIEDAINDCGESCEMYEVKS